jgi:hypothetical protein
MDDSPLRTVLSVVEDVTRGVPVDFDAVRAELGAFVDQAAALEHELDLVADDRAWAAGVWAGLADRLVVAVDHLERSDLPAAKVALRQAMGLDP